MVGTGLYDMHGNANEWCDDRPYVYYPQDVTNPHGPSSGGNRVIRGGAFDYLARRCRSATRYDYRPDFPSSNFGFRPVRSVF